MWDELQPIKAEKEKAPVRVGLMKIRDNRARLVVMLNAETLALLGEVHRYRLSLGSGENAHQARIAYDESGPFEPTQFGLAKGTIYFRFCFPPVDYLPNEKMVVAGCRFNHDAKGKALVIDLPKYAWRPSAIRAAR